MHVSRRNALQIRNRPTRVSGLLLLIGILLSSFSEPETYVDISAKRGVYILKIYPLKADSATYIRREFVRATYCREEVFSHGRRILLTTFNTYNGKMGYDEFVYSTDSGKERMVMLREYHQGNTAPARKTILLHDSTCFVMDYYPNGNIRSCAVETSFCKRYNGYEFDEQNLQYSTGRYSPEVRTDTTAEMDGEREIQIIRMHCGDQTGAWRTYSFEHQLLGTQKFD